jgi:hypothetical protein
VPRSATVASRSHRAPRDQHRPQAALLDGPHHRRRWHSAPPTAPTDPD